MRHVSVAMPTDSRCETKGTKMRKSASEKLLGN